MYAIIIKHLPRTDAHPLPRLKAVMGDGEFRVSITIPCDPDSKHPDRDAAQALLDKYHPDLAINTFGHLPDNQVVATLINKKPTYGNAKCNQCEARICMGQDTWGLCETCASKIDWTTPRTLDIATKSLEGVMKKREVGGGKSALLDQDQSTPEYIDTPDVNLSEIEENDNE